MLFISRIIAAAIVACVLSACGQKGPLFLAPQSVPFKLLPASPASEPAALAASPTPATPASVAK